MRIAVTGASGFTGRFVEKALTTIGATCVPLSVDLRDAAAVAIAVKEASFDRLIHLAAVAFVHSNDWGHFYSVNQLGTYNLLKAVCQTKPGTRCILASSAQVYGPGVSGLIAEDAITTPNNHYAVSKRAMELGALLWSDKLDVVIARPFNYTGIGQDVKYIIPKIVDHFQRKAPSIDLGNTWVRRDFGDVRSVAEAYTGLALARESPKVVNISTGVLSSIDDVLGILGRLTGHTMQVRATASFIRSNDVPTLGGDATLLRKTLPQWQAHDLEDTLEWMYHHKSFL